MRSKFWPLFLSLNENKLFCPSGLFWMTTFFYFIFFSVENINKNVKSWKNTLINASTWLKLQRLKKLRSNVVVAIFSRLLSKIQLNITLALLNDHGRGTTKDFQSGATQILEKYTELT